MSRLGLLSLLAGPTPEEELQVQASGGQSFTLRPDPTLSALSPEAKEALFGGQASGDLAAVYGPQGERLDGGYRNAGTGQQLSSLSEDDLVAIGAAERDPSTGQLVMPGTANPMTAARGFDRRIALPFIQERYEERQKLSRAGRDFDTIRELVADGSINIDTANKAIESAVAKSGLSRGQLLQLPSFRWAADAEGEYEQMRQQRRVQESARTGIPVEGLNADATDTDPLWEKAQNWKLAQAQLAQKPITILAESQLSTAAKQFEKESRQIDIDAKAMGELTRNPVAAANYRRQKTDEAWKRYQDQVTAATGQKVSAQETVSASQGGGAQPAPAQQQLTHPKLPPGVSLSGSYATAAEAKANMPTSSYALIDGTLFRRTAWGGFEIVQ